MRRGRPTPEGLITNQEASRRDDAVYEKQEGIDSADWAHPNQRRLAKVASSHVGINVEGVLNDNNICTVDNRDWQ